MHHLWSKGDYEVSTDPARIDVLMVHEVLTSSYWAKGIPLKRSSNQSRTPFLSAFIMASSRSALPALSLISRPSRIWEMFSLFLITVDEVFPGG